ncbi:MAG: hypothetical protein WBW84_19450 [Acidobacteriaceae bacterium]
MTTDIIAAHKRQTMKDQIIAAYEAYQRKEALSGERLMGLVRDFAYRKVYHLEYNFAGMGTAQTADDWAQDVALKIWTVLPRIPETVQSGQDFYSYLHKTAFNKASKAFNYLTGKILNEDGEVIGYRDEGRGKAPLTVMREGEDGEQFEDDNPEIYNRTTINESHFTIPDSVQGKDLTICNLILTGKTYAHIGALLGITEDAVKARLKRLRTKLSPEKEAKRKAERARNDERWRPFKINHPSKAPSPSKRSGDVDVDVDERDASAMAVAALPEGEVH